MNTNDIESVSDVVLDPIEQDLAVDKARIFKVRTILADLTSKSSRYDMTGVELGGENVVRVFSDDGQVLLGHATLSIENGKLLAQLFIDYASQERLLIETRQARLYARMVGYLKFVHPRVDRFLTLSGPKPLVKKIFVENLIITPVAPPDSALLPLGEVII